MNTDTTVTNDNENTITHPWIKSHYGCELQTAISPSLAQFLLEKYNQVNEGVRSITAKHVGAIADALKNGHWISESGLNIGFDEEGQILDGQGRLKACVDTGIDLIIDVFYGMKRKAVAVRDGNKPRSDSTRLLMSDGLKHTREERVRLGAKLAIARVWLWQQTDFKKMFKGSHLSLMEFVLQEEAFIEAALAPGEMLKARSAGFRAACAQYIKKYPEKGKEFLSQVIGSGAGLEEGSPTLYLRNHFLNRKAFNGGQAGQKSDYFKTLHSIHCFHNGTRQAKITEKKEWDI